MSSKKRKTFHVVLEGPANAVTTNKDCNHVAVVGRNGKSDLFLSLTGFIDFLYVIK